MISYLEGPVIAAGVDHIVINVGGIGFRVEAPTATVSRFSSVRPEHDGVARVHTSLIVREDSLTLFGFESPGERDAFDVLLGISGIGPRLGLAAINQLGVEGLRVAIASQNIAALSQISGVGKKTAQRMVLEIGDKLGAPSDRAESGSAPSGDQVMRDLVKTTLEQYGLSRSVAAGAVDSLTGEYQDMATMLRDAFARAGSGRA